MYNFVIFILILAVRQQTAESARTTAHVLFQPQTPVSLADSYLTVDIAVPLPKLLNVDLRPIYKFSSKLQQLEQKTWKSSQFCNNSEISALLQHHFDGVISSIQTEYERAEKERTKLVKEVASFVNQTITLQRQRRSPLLFAMGAATAITLEPLLEKAGCRLLSIFGLCESSKRKMEQLEGRLHYLESRMVHLHNEEKESIQVMASSSLKLHEDTRKVLNYSKDDFEILQTWRCFKKQWKKYNKPKPVIIEGLTFLCMPFAPKVQLTTYRGLSMLCTVSCKYKHYICWNRETCLLQALECYPKEHCQPH